MLKCFKQMSNCFRIPITCILHYSAEVTFAAERLSEFEVYLQYGPCILRRFWNSFFSMFLSSMDQIFWPEHWAMYGLLEPHNHIWMKQT